MKLYNIPKNKSKQLVVYLFLTLVCYPNITSGLPIVSSISKFLEDWLGMNGDELPGDLAMNKIPNCIPKGAQKATPVSTAWSSQQTNGNTVSTTSGSKSFSSSSYSSSDPQSANGLDDCSEVMNGTSTDPQSSSSSTMKNDENPVDLSDSFSEDTGLDGLPNPESDFLSNISSDGLLKSLGDDLGGSSSTKSTLGSSSGLGRGAANSFVSTTGGSSGNSGFLPSSTSIGGDGITNTSLLGTTATSNGTGLGTGKIGGNYSTNLGNTSESQINPKALGNVSSGNSVDYSNDQDENCD